MTEQKNLVILIPNWMGGSNILYGLSSVLDGQSQQIICPEVEAWTLGENLHENPEKLVIPNVKSGDIFYFRSPIVCSHFLKKANLEKHNLAILCQVRDPYDLLVAEYYGDTLRHFPPLGHEKKWSKMRRKNIIEGVENYCVRRSLELKQAFSELQKYDACIETLTYEEMVSSPRRYTEKLFSIVNLQNNKEDFVDAISLKGGITNTLGKTRMHSALEWPHPGRGKWILNNLKTRVMIKNNLGYYLTLFSKDSYDYSVVAPPIMARRLPRIFMLFYIFLRFNVKPILHRLKSLF